MKFEEYAREMERKEEIPLNELSFSFFKKPDGITTKLKSILKMWEDIIKIIKRKNLPEIVKELVSFYNTLIKMYITSQDELEKNLIEGFLKGLGRKLENISGFNSEIAGYVYNNIDGGGPIRNRNYPHVDYHDLENSFY